jgi:hypothetical protein
LGNTSQQILKSEFVLYYSILYNLLISVLITILGFSIVL